MLCTGLQFLGIAVVSLAIAEVRLTVILRPWAYRLAVQRCPVPAG